jgi:hypothetical protein
MAQRREEDEGIHRSPDDDQEKANADDDVTAARGQTVREQRSGETLRTRVAREESEREPREAHRESPGRLVEQTDGDGADIVKELVADESDDRVAYTAEEDAMSVRGPDDPLPDERRTDERDADDVDHSV